MYCFQLSLQKAFIALLILSFDFLWKGCLIPCFSLTAPSHSTRLFSKAVDNCEALYLLAWDVTLGPLLQTFVWHYATQRYDSLSSKVSCHNKAGMKPAEPAHPRQPPFGPFPEVTNTGRAGRGGAHFQPPSHAPAIQGHLLKMARLRPWNGAMSFLLLFSSSLLQEDRVVCRLGEAKVVPQTRQISQYTSPTPQHHCSEPLGYPCLYMYILHPCSSLSK